MPRVKEHKCSCFGIPGRVHSLPDCPLFKRLRDEATVAHAISDDPENDPAVEEAFNLAFPGRRIKPWHKKHFKDAFLAAQEHGIEYVYDGSTLILVAQNSEAEMTARAVYPAIQTLAALAAHNKEENDGNCG